MKISIPQAFRANIRRILNLYLPVYIILLLLSLLLWHYGNRYITENLQHGWEEQLMYTADDINACSEQFDRLLRQLVYDKDLCTSYNNQPYSVLNNLQQKLSLYTLTQSGLDNLWYHCVGDKYWYSGTDSGESSRIAQRFQLDKMVANPEDLLDAAHPSRVLSAVDTYTSVRCLLYCYRISYGMPSSTHIVIFQMRSDFFENRITRLLDDKSGCVFLLDEYGEPLVSRSNSTSDLDSMQRFAVPLSGSPLTLVLYVNPTIQNLSTRILLGCTLALLIIVVLLLSRISARRSYEPIQHLRQKVASFLGDENDEGKNDYEYIESSIELACIEQKRLTQDMNSQQNAIEHYVLYSLLGGHVQDEDSFRHETRLLSIRLPEVSFRFIILIARNTQALQLLSSIQSDLKQHFGSELSLCVHLSNPGCIALVPYLPPEDESVFLEKFERYVDKLRQLHWKTCSFAVGISLPDDSLSRLPLMFAQACFASGESRQPGYYDIPSKELGFPSAAELLTGLDNCLKEQEPVNDAQLRTLQSQVLACLSSSELNISALDAPEAFAPQEGQPSAVCLSHLRSMLEAANTQQQVLPSEKMSQIEEINQYVENNYDNPLFSIQLMADHFCMSTASISGYFKKHNGILLTERITELKMEKAKQLLRETTLSVQDIGMSVGYYNVNSFIRRFRLFTKMTPGEYRQATNETLPDSR